VAQVLGQSTLQLSCSNKVTALPSGHKDLHVQVHLASTVMQCVMAPWTCGPVMGFPDRALPLSVFVFDEGGRVITANALANRHEARTAVRAQGKLQHGPLFDYLSTTRPWGDASYSLRAGRTDRVFVVFTGNTDEEGAVEEALRLSQPHAATAAVMAIVDKALAGGTEAFIVDRLVNGLRTQLVELDAAHIMRMLAVPKLLSHIQQAAVTWGRSREEAHLGGFAGQVYAAASAAGVAADEDTVTAVTNATLVVDISSIVAGMVIPPGATARSLQSAMPSILGFATQALLDRKLLEWAVLDTSRTVAFGAERKGLFAILQPNTQEVKFAFSAEKQLLLPVARKALLLTGLHVSCNISDVVPSPEAPHMVVVDRAIASASGGVRRVQEQVAGLRLGGRALGGSERASGQVNHVLAFSNSAVSMYRQVIQKTLPPGPRCCGLVFHVSPGDPAQLLVVQCPEVATLVHRDSLHDLYGGYLDDGVHLCSKGHRCVVSGGHAKATSLHPMEVAASVTGVHEGVLSRLASIVIQAAHASQLLLPV